MARVPIMPAPRSAAPLRRSCEREPGATGPPSSWAEERQANCRRPQWQQLQPRSSSPHLLWKLANRVRLPNFRGERSHMLTLFQGGEVNRIGRIIYRLLANNSIDHGTEGSVLLYHKKLRQPKSQ